MTQSYDEFLARKAINAPVRGLKKIPPLNPAMFPHQQDSCAYLLGVGCGAAFLDTGLGKALLALEFGRVVVESTNKPFLMLAPLAVGAQHVRESARFGIESRTIRTMDDVGPGINIANYERLHLLDRHAFGGIALDESSIIKSFTGKTTRALMAFAADMPFRLCATATPAPNDHMELGQHAQFLGVMDSSEMLARWFIADQSEMGRYRLKRHGVAPFWSWVASWARCCAKPSDMGYSDDGFILPPLNIHRHSVDADLMQGAEDGSMFRTPDTSATSIHKEKRITAPLRAERVAEIVARQPNESWVIWVDTDYDADEIRKRIPEAIEVRGSMPLEKKEDYLVAFSEGRERVLLTKPKIAGFGLNWQHCANTVFGGISFSYEAYYQAIRRFYRFGQKREVNCHVVLADTEEVIWQSIQRKAKDHEEMKAEMVKAMSRDVITRSVRMNYQPKTTVKLPGFLGAA